MASLVSEGQPKPGVREQVATRFVFFAIGFVMAAWAPLVPLTKDRLAVDDARLGTLLLCLGVGSILAMPFAGGLAARFGCRTVILTAGAVACLALPFQATANTAGAMAMALVLSGAGIGLVDVVMNVQASMVEKASGKAMMSGFHGLFSVGGIAGAGGLTGLLALGLAPLAASLTVVGVAAALFALSARGLLPYGGEEQSPLFVWPRGRVLLLGTLAFVLFLAEGSVLDWSGVLMNTLGGLDQAKAGLGYVAFSVTMTIGRLAGDRIVRRFGPARVLGFGGFCAAAGFALAALVPTWPVAMVGFALVGAGASNVVPVLFSAAGRQTSMPSNLAIAAVTAMGYAGIMAGPGLIGFLAQATTLPMALLFVAWLLLGVALMARVATSEK